MQRLQQGGNSRPASAGSALTTVVRKPGSTPLEGNASTMHVVPTPPTTTRPASAHVLGTQLHGKQSADEFWAALQTDYNYLMNDQLIQSSCKEASGELSCDDEDMTSSNNWSFTGFMEQYNELMEWLHAVQDAVQNGNHADIKLHLAEMQQRAYRRKLFNEHSEKLSRRYPELSTEIKRRVKLLNEKWLTLEKAITPKKEKRNEQKLYNDLEHDVHSLRKWLQQVENTLRPLAIKAGWTVFDLEKRLTEHTDSC